MTLPRFPLTPLGCALVLLELAAVLDIVNTVLDCCLQRGDFLLYQDWMVL